MARDQRVGNFVAAGAGQAVTHAALNSLSPASATVEDITDQVSESALQLQAAEFIAQINAQSNAGGNYVMPATSAGRVCCSSLTNMGVVL